jgi:hypothetical protein
VRGGPPLQNIIQFGANQNDLGNQVEPRQKYHNGRKRAIRVLFAPRPAAQMPACRRTIHPGKRWPPACALNSCL